MAIIRIEIIKIGIMEKLCASNADSQVILPLTVPMEAIIAIIKAIQQVESITIGKGTTQIVIKTQRLLGKIKRIVKIKKIIIITIIPKLLLAIDVKNKGILLLTALIKAQIIVHQKDRRKPKNSLALNAERLAILLQTVLKKAKNRVSIMSIKTTIHLKKK